MKALSIYMIGTQGRSVTSGPGTFMRYICQAVAEGELVAEVFFPHSSKGSDFSQYEFVKFSEKAERFHDRFFGSWIISSFYVWRHLVRSGARSNRSTIWFADRYSALFCVLDPALRARCIAMVNDDTRIKKRQPLELGNDRLLKRCANRVSGGILHFFERFIVRRCGFVVSNSDYLSRQIEVCYRLPSCRVSRLYKAVDLSLFQRRAEPVFAKEPFVLLYVKNEWFRGGLDILIQALAGIDDYRFIVKVVGISKLSEQSSIRAVAQKCNFQHELTMEGTVDRLGIAKLLQDSDVLCVPSRKEALGVALLEGLASGIPVISTNVGGIPEVLNGGAAGVMVEPENVAALRNGIIETIQDGDLRFSRIENGLTHVQNFDRSIMIEAITRLSTQSVFD